jgi:hypothetical protein
MIFIATDVVGTARLVSFASWHRWSPFILTVLIILARVTESTTGTCIPKAVSV